MSTYCICLRERVSRVPNGSLKSPLGDRYPRSRRIIKGILILLVTTLIPISAWAEVITLTPIKDTYVDQSKPTSSYTSSTLLQTKYESTITTATFTTTSFGSSSPSGSRFGFKSPSKPDFGPSPPTSRSKTGSGKEALLQFDLSSIPQGAKITSAYLKLYNNYNRSFRKDAATRVYATLGSWSESTPWNTKPPRASTYEASISVTTTKQYFQWNITNLVQDWVDGVEKNYGVTIRSEGGGQLYFSSRESSSNKPILYVEYTAPLQNQPPTLSLEANPSSGEAPLTVTFHSNAYDPDGSIVEYRWDYDGDGIIDEVTYSDPVSVIYDQPGTYNAEVEVIDNQGMSSWDSVTVNVSIPIVLQEVSPGRYEGEAEDSTLVPPLQVGSDPDASNGEYVYWEGV